MLDVDADVDVPLPYHRLPQILAGRVVDAESAESFLIRAELDDAMVGSAGRCIDFDKPLANAAARVSHFSETLIAMAYGGPAAFTACR